MDKSTIGHLHNGILLSSRKEEMLPFVVAWMDLENIMLSGISHSEKGKHLNKLITRKIDTDS